MCTRVTCIFFNIFFEKKTVNVIIDDVEGSTITQVWTFFDLAHCTACYYLFISQEITKV